MHRSNLVFKANLIDWTSHSANLLLATARRDTYIFGEAKLAFLTILVGASDISNRIRRLLKMKSMIVSTEIFRYIWICFVIRSFWSKVFAEAIIVYYSQNGPPFVFACKSELFNFSMNITLIRDFIWLFFFFIRQFFFCIFFILFSIQKSYVYLPHYQRNDVNSQIVHWTMINV